LGRERRHGQVETYGNWYYRLTATMPAMAIAGINGTYKGARVVVADLNGAGAREAAAAIGHDALGLHLEVTRQESINVEGLLFTLQAAAKQMIAQGGGGRVINFASQAGRRGEALVAVYCSSKAAVISLTQSAGLDLIKHDINVNAVAPGVADNEHWEDVDARFARYEGLQPGEKRRAVGVAVPFGRMARPEEIAGLAVFLAGLDAGYIVAQTYNIDGGNWMS